MVWLGVGRGLVVLQSVSDGVRSEGVWGGIGEGLTRFRFRSGTTVNMRGGIARVVVSIAERMEVEGGSERMK